MAIFHFSAQIIGRSSGRSAVSAAAYRAAMQLHDERLDRDHDFRAKTGVVHREILLPEGAPKRWLERERLWNEVEAGEKRKDAQLAREVEFAIPREMGKADGIALARDFVVAEFVARGMVADLNVHWDVDADGQAKPHAHVMLAMRGVEGDGFGPKVRAWNEAALVALWRERWADHVNARLAALDIDARVDHRSLADQGIDLEPQSKIGAAAKRIESTGTLADRAEVHREIARENGERILADPSLALEAITHGQATFTVRDMARLAHRHSEGVEQFNAVLRAVRNSPDTVALGQDGRGEERFTSRAMIETEQRLHGAVDRLAEREDHDVGEQARTAALAMAEARGLRLSGEQRAAFARVTDARGLSLVIGYAGTGKSAMLGVAREAWERAGLAVRGAALAGIAAEGLEKDSGMASRTLASLEHGWARGEDLLTSRDVLVIDEAGLVGTRQLERVLAHADEARAKVVLIGDPQQLQAIEAGAAFRAIHERHGGVEITQVRRQHSDWQREATRHLATGRIGLAVAAYAGHGMVHEAESREAARADLIERWDRGRQASRIMLTHTNAEVRELNRAARERLHAAGHLGADTSVETARGSRAFAQGDRVMFLRNERSLEVKNGTLATIEQVGPSSIAVRTDDGRTVAFDWKDYRDLDHGYAATIHKAQGMTVDRVHVLATPGMDRHAAYVALSRHRDGVDLHYGQDDFADRSRLVRLLSREQAKDMATDYDHSDSVRIFAEHRGIGWREHVAEIIREVPERARSIFAGFRPKVVGRPHVSPQGQDRERAPGFGTSLSRRPESLHRAVEHYARALDAIEQIQGRGMAPLPHQGQALARARAALDAAQANAAGDLDSAFRLHPHLVHEAAQGRTAATLQALQREAESRVDPFRRAGRFVEQWQQLRRDHDELVRDGNFRAARTAAQRMAEMARSVDVDSRLATWLGLRGEDLGLTPGRGSTRTLSRDLAATIPPDRERTPERERGRDR